MKMMEETPFDDDLKNKIVQATEIFHEESTELSRTFLSETARTNYVTPTRFLDLMQVFQSLLDKQRNYLYDKKLSYESGIQKLMQQ
jgi:dynein heavy chain